MARLRNALFQADVRWEGGEAIAVPIWPLPFSIGRHPQDSLSVAVPGVWERHMVIDWVPGEGWVAMVREDAVARLAGGAFRRHPLRNGDEMELGGLSVRLFVTRAERRSLRAREVAFWLIFFVVCGIQALILAGLLGEG